MRRYAAILAFAHALVGSAVADTSKERVITVTGSAAVFVKPDRAMIHYGVRAQEPAVDAAKDVVTKSVSAMDEAVKKLKLAGLTTSAAPVTIRQGQMNPNGIQIAPAAPGAPAPVAGGLGPFTANAAFTATINESNPDKLKAAVEAFVKAVTEAGANTCGDDREINEGGGFIPGQAGNGGPKVVLSKADETTAREQALEKAVLKAVSNAKSIAKALGVKDVTVVSVTEGEVEKTVQNENIYGIYGIESPGSKTPAGEVEVRVRVVVKCSY